jgi:hypothetical protein
VTPEKRKSLAEEFGRRLLAARAKRRHSVQKLHDLMKAKGMEPINTRTIQRHEAGDLYPWPTTREMYAAIYPEVL